MTRCDVYVDCDGQMGRVAMPNSWGTWWALDGGDTTATLLALAEAAGCGTLGAPCHQGHRWPPGDEAAKLNLQVREVQQTLWVPGADGSHVTFRCHLTGSQPPVCKRTVME